MSVLATLARFVHTFWGIRKVLQRMLLVLLGLLFTRGSVETLAAFGGTTASLAAPKMWASAFHFVHNIPQLCADWKSSHAAKARWQAATTQWGDVHDQAMYMAEMLRKPIETTSSHKKRE